MQAQADWLLDSARSELTFASTKNGEITEVHMFRKFEGTVSSKGEALLTIDLNSVDTRIPIRDKRMREVLFLTPQFPRAEFTTRIKLAPLLELQNDTSYSTLLSGELSLHGIKLVVEVPVEVTANGGGVFEVLSEESVDIDAASVGLLKGVEELRKIAGLASISPIVPVNFRLVFVPETTP